MVCSACYKVCIGSWYVIWYMVILAHIRILRGYILHGTEYMVHGIW